MVEKKAKIEIEEKGKLSEQKWFKGIYVKIYDILSVNGRLPEPDKISVAVIVKGEVDRRILAFAVKECNALWFRSEPPEPAVYTHELIHLCRKEAEVLEEIYATNLTYIVILMACENVKPKKHPLELFEKVTLKELMETIRKVYKVKFKDIAEYFQQLGIVPTFCKLEVVNGKITLKINEKYDEKTIVITAISELIAGAQYDPLMKQVIYTLLEAS